MGFRVVPGVPLGDWNPVPELIEDVRDLFIMDSSISEVIPLFRLPGLEQVRRILHVERQHIDLGVYSFFNDKTHLGTSCDGVPLGKSGSKAECALPPLSLRLRKYTTDGNKWENTHEI